MNHKGHFKNILKVVIFAFIALSIHAQNNTFYLKKLNSEKAIEKNLGGYIQIDKNGFIWVGTQDGLMCYDGYSFKRLNSLVENHRRVHYMKKDQKGNIYVCYSNYKWYQVTLDHKGPALRYICDFANQSFYTSLELKLIKKVQDAKHNATVADIFAKHILVKMKNAIEVDNEIYNIIDNKFYKIVGFHNQEFIYHPIEVAGLEIGTGDVIFSDQFSDRFFIFKDRLYKVQYRNHKLCFDVIYNQIFGAQKENITLLKYLPTYDEFIFSTSHNGIFKLIPHDLEVLKFDLNILAQKNVYYNLSLHPFTKELIVGNSLLLKSDSTRHILSDYPMLFSHTTSDSNGNLYYRDGNHIEVRNAHLKIIDSFALAENDLHDMEFSFCEGDSLCIFSNSACIYTLFIKNRDIRQIFLLDNQTGKESFTILKRIIKIKNQYWLLTNDGIWVLDIYKGTIKPLEHAPKVFFRNVYLTKGGRAKWFCTEHNGLYLYWDEQWYKVKSDRMGFLNFPHAVLDDHLGYLWISTNYGLIKVKEDVLIQNTINDQVFDTYFQYFTTFNGLLTDEFNGGSHSNGIKLKNNELLFASMNGIVKVNVMNLVSPFSVSPIFLYSVKVDGKTIAHDKTIHVNSGYRSIDIDVVSAHYGNALNYFIEYKIKGYDDTWYPLSDNYSIFIGELKPGSYSLDFRKRRGFDNMDYMYDSFSLEIKPKLYQTFGAKLFIFMMILFVFYIAVRWKNKRLLIENKKLNLIIDEKVNQLFEQKQNSLNHLQLALENKAKLLNYKKDIVKMVTHDIISPISAVVEATKLLEDNLKYEEISQLETLSEMIRKSCEKTLYMSYRLRANGGQEDNQPLRIETFNDLILSIKNLYGLNFYLKKIDFTYTIDSGLEQYKEDFLSGLEIIVRNIISNILKHGQSKSIHIVIDKNSTVEVRDVGVTLDMHIVDYIYDILYDEDKDSHVVGTGLRLIKIQLNQLGYKLTILPEASGNLYRLEPGSF